MATVTGVTAERADQIEAASIVGATIQGNDLVLTTHGGTLINVGRVKDSLAAWPIGSVFMHTTSTNPSVLIGGSWVRWGEGRMPVSVSSTDSDFDAAGETGGSKTHVLTVAELPSHDHSGKTGIQDAKHSHTGATEVDGAHSHTGTTATAGIHNHETQRINNDNKYGVSTQSGAQRDVFPATLEDVTTSSAGTHSHTFSTASGGGHAHAVTTLVEESEHKHVINPQGSGHAHNNMPPYMTVYMWRRTA